MRSAQPSEDSLGSWPDPLRTAVAPRHRGNADGARRSWDDVGAAIRRGVTAAPLILVQMVQVRILAAELVLRSWIGSASRTPAAPSQQSACRPRRIANAGEPTCRRAEPDHLLDHRAGRRRRHPHAVGDAQGAAPDRRANRCSGTRSTPPPPCSPSNLVAVIGHGREQVGAYLTDEHPTVRQAIQDEQLGTGHAVASALDEIAEWTGTVLVTYGDVPLLTGETLSRWPPNTSGPATRSPC